ncbi:MAG: adenylate/guanylate cyclase domain-containing protein [Chloroflexota bacterium]
MICSNCGAPNTPGRRFCGECAAPLVVACPNCGAGNEPTVKFCGECATPLAGVASVGGQRAPDRTPAVAAPVAERRLVSILFADLVGFTTLAESRDAEDTRELLSRYFALAEDVIGRYGGTIEKFIGDAVMAVWGAPTAREDDAERAVRAALELVDAVRSLGPGIAARAGVLTGEAAVTLGATNQGMVAGDLVNTASRLQSAAASGTVLVGEATYQAADKAIAFEEAGEQTLKGKASPVPAWRAVRVVSERGGRNRSDALEAPFVGRADELRLLKDLYHATTREERPRLVSVIGAAGIGKTRLAWEFLKYIDGVLETVLWHDGRSPAYGEGITFWALGEMVRGRCGLLETDDESTTRIKVAATVSDYVPDPDERRWIEAALLTLLGVESGIGSEQLFGAWRTFFERLAATGPVVMVFEDFHLADTGLMDFVDHLLDWSRTVPIYVVTLARPELLDRRSGWGVGKRAFNSIYLEPLDAAEMRDLLAGLVPGLPEAPARAIVSRADGIPLYAVETVRMLLADGRLSIEDGAYRPVGDLTSLAVPATLTALIASRLDALEPNEHALVSDAAVLGQSFTIEGLAAVSGRESGSLAPALQTLVRREILELKADPRSPERGQYAFVQGLIREVAYATLAKPDRKVRHLGAARFFESLGSDELAGALAGHYLAAHANAPDGPEREALGNQARIALRAGAERAAGLGAHDQAITMCEEALTVTSDPADEAALHERAANSAWFSQKVDQAEHHFKAALALRGELGDRVAEARTTAEFGRALLSFFHFEPALALLTEASERFKDLGDETTLAKLDGQLARAWFLTDEPGRAITAADRVLPIAERHDLIEVVADTLVTRGSALVYIGRRYEGVGAIETAQRLAAAHSLTLVENRALNNLSSVLYDSDPRAGLEAARSGLEVARRLGIRSFQLLENAREEAIRLGEWDWISAELATVLNDDVDALNRTSALGGTIIIRALRGAATVDQFADLEAIPMSGDDTVQPVTIAEVAAWVAYAEGRFDLARIRALEVGRLFLQARLEASLLAARCALLAGDAVAARDDLAMAQSTDRRGRVIDADATTINAGIAALDGRARESLSLYREALRAWRDLGLAWDEARCAIDMAVMLGPSEPEVSAAADAATVILTRLGAKPFLERLESAMAVRPGSQVEASPTPTGAPAEPIAETRH